MPFNIDLLTLKLLQRLVGMAGIHIDILDSKRCVEYVDDKWLKRYGAPRGRKCHKYYLGKASPCPRCGAKKALLTKRPVVTEKKFLAGDKKNYRIFSIPFKGPDRKWHVAEVNIDITKCKDTERLLVESRERYCKLAELSHDFIFIVNQDGVVEYVNEAGAKEFGRRVEDVIGEKVKALFPKKVADRHMANIKKVITTGKELYIENMTRFPGRDAWLDSWLIPLNWSSSGKRSVLGISRDTTQRKAVEERLRENEKMYRTMVENSNDIIFMLDQNRKIVYCNKRAEHVMGYKLVDWIGKGYNRLMDKADVGRMDKVFDDVMSGKPRQYEVSLYRKDGSRIVLSINSAPIMKAGSVVGTISFGHDISRIKAEEDGLRKDKTSLEMAVTLRTRELLAAKEELYRSKHLADIGMLAATVAHEVRNPIAAIRVAAYNIRKKSNDQSIKPNLANIEKKVMETDRIINNLLYYARIKSPHLQEVNLCEILGNCVETAKVRYGDCGVRLNFNSKRAPRCVTMADPFQMSEVFDNLLNNSYEALEGRCGRVNVCISRSGNDLFMISFTDNGPGIDMEHIHRVGEPFFTTKARGTGLGLSVCEMIVRMHNGKIDIRNVPNGGTRVEILLPISSGIQVVKGQKKEERVPLHNR